MKKYINKLFEWLGYVPKTCCRDCKQRNKMDKLCKEGNVRYMFCEGLNRYIVFILFDNDYRYTFTVKSIPFADDDSRDYARICAEELCEMLNEKY